MSNDPKNYDRKHDPKNSPMGDEHQTRVPPSLEAVEQHAEEGNGPFGSDMTHMKGGTHQPGDVERQGGPYSSGTSPVTGGSVNPDDARSNYRDSPGTSNETGSANRPAPESEKDGEP